MLALDHLRKAPNTVTLDDEDIKEAIKNLGLNPKEAKIQTVPKRDQRDFYRNGRIFVFASENLNAWEIGENRPNLHESMELIRNATPAETFKEGLVINKTIYYESDYVSGYSHVRFTDFSEAKPVFSLWKIETKKGPLLFPVKTIFDFKKSPEMNHKKEAATYKKWNHFYMLNGNNQCSCEYDNFSFIYFAV